MKTAPLVAAGLILLSIGTPLHADPARPNVLLFFADDMGYSDCQHYQPASIVDMPRLETLATQGLTFSNAYSAASLCQPSRYAVLAGNYPFRGGGAWNFNGGANLYAGQVAIAAMMQTAGYRTSRFGKGHIGARVPVKGGGLVPTNGWFKHMFHDMDLSQPLTDGLISRGFDYSFVAHGGIQDVPYAYHENDMLVTDLGDITGGLVSAPFDTPPTFLETTTETFFPGTPEEKAVDLVVWNHTAHPNENGEGDFKAQNFHTSLADRNAGDPTVNGAGWGMEYWQSNMVYQLDVQLGKLLDALEIRVGDWKLMIDHKANPATPLGLYNLARDPGSNPNFSREIPDFHDASQMPDGNTSAPLGVSQTDLDAGLMNNLVNDPAQSQRVADMLALYNQHYDSTTRTTPPLNFGGTTPQAPIAQDDPGITATTDARTTIPFLNNDTDANGDDLTAILIDAPAHGSLLLLDGTFIYTPDPGYTGGDSFTYRTSDGTLESNPATVTITVSTASAGADILYDNIALNGIRTSASGGGPPVTDPTIAAIHHNTAQNEVAIQLNGLVPGETYNIAESTNLSSFHSIPGSAFTATGTTRTISPPDTPDTEPARFFIIVSP